MRLPCYLELLTGAEQTLAQAYRTVAEGHRADADVDYMCRSFAQQSDAHIASLIPVCDRYAYAREEPETERLYPPEFGPARGGPIGLLRDLAELHQLATFTECTWELVGQAAHGVRDRDLIDLCAESDSHLNGQLAWLRMRMKTEAAQALLAA